MPNLNVVALAAISAMTAAWIWQQRKANAGVVDVVWAFGMMSAGFWYALTGPAPLYLKLSLALLTGGWYLRLGIHLAGRVFSEAEDGRYRAMRTALGKYAAPGFLLFFLLQAAFVWILSLPFFAVAQNSHPKPLLVISALLLAGLALWGEAAADQDLAKFRGDPENRGKSCRNGWWRYSRHPNYFFEWLQWFAYPLLGWGGPYQYWLWLAPALMFCFLYFFTGIPFSEQQSLRSRGEDYRKYQQATSKFFPWWPKPEP